MCMCVCPCRHSAYAKGVQALRSVKRLETISLFWRYKNKIEYNWILPSTLGVYLTLYAILLRPPLQRLLFHLKQRRPWTERSGCSFHIAENGLDLDTIPTPWAMASTLPARSFCLSGPITSRLNTFLSSAAPGKDVLLVRSSFCCCH